ELTDEELFTDANPLAPYAGQVVLELTERARLETLTDAPARIAMLRAMGFSFAIDDLGAGYAGLGSLAVIEPEVVKLDMGLVRDIATNPTKRRIVAATARLCRELGSQVVAEGVETAEERAFLVDHVDLLQGYLFGRPERALINAST
ncbi:MAG: EAL domain-containing protein, partial [Deltaproteobacteria bacterium]|nr:EAL domain-containing protein [Kofleriaceae bacterium]